MLHVDQSLLIAEIYRHSITSSTLTTWLRPPRPNGNHAIVWIYLVFCVLYVKQSLLIAKVYQHSITSTSTTTKRKSGRKLTSLILYSSYVHLRELSGKRYKTLPPVPSHTSFKLNNSQSPNGQSDKNFTPTTAEQVVKS